MIRQSGCRIEELAGLTKIPEVSLYKLIRGEEKYSAQAVYNLTEALGCSLEELLEGDDD